MKTIIILLLVTAVYSKSVERRDPMINEGLFEGDIRGIDPNQDRNAVPKDSMRWPNGVIPYEVDPALYGIWELLMKSIRHIEDNSCIRFVQRTHEKNYIRIIKGNGCWSDWGRAGNGEQPVSIGEGCQYFGTIVHELMHAVGFGHEHSREDRDDYITIHWENINPRSHNGFKKYIPEQQRLLNRFDYDSIMMYGERSFSIRFDLKSMTAKDGTFLEEVYTKPGLSPIDIQRIALLYNCPRK
ncbi:Astacin-like metalloprotease toxin 1 [Araneus ventricosus]|uniref:Metalloendopeptidase n=1 Tax=Araneus ventricosus TaxID=182803 RepID=A0A4Y2N5K8_ARAVE|nr:Astacin-like metalloprotease toxin 1 [Araneus ventricosus]